MAGIKDEKFITIRGINKGLNTFDDPQDIDDKQVANCLNMVFRNGYPEPRGGSRLKWEKPASESNDLLALLAARDSTGQNFAVAIYAPNWYVRDEDNDQWIKINNGYTPSATYIDLMYSYVNWNEGRSADTLYACNGREKFIKWQIGLAHTSAAAAASDTTIILDDASYFPNTGTIVIKAASGSEIYTSYTSKSTNTLNLASGLSSAVASGAGVTFEMDDVATATMPPGKVLSKFQGRLVVANGYGSETTVFYSAVGNPEDFTVGSDTDEGGTEVITDGEKDILSLQDFGEYLLIVKGDSSYRLSFLINQDLATKLAQIVPIYSDTSMGPVTPWAVSKKNNLLYYPTETEGIFSFNPNTTGTQTTIESMILSQPIQDLVTSLDFSLARTATYNQFLLWSAATDSVIDTVIVYDLLRGNWTRFNNWAVRDWLIHNKILLFGSTVDNNIYETFTDTNIDLESDTVQTPYEVSFTTKRFDFGQPSKHKTMTYLHIQGYLSDVTTLYIEIMYNEAGRLQTITRSIAGTNDLIYQPVSTALAMVMLGIPIMGGSDIADLDSIGFMNFYLPIPIKYGFLNFQVRFYTSAAAASWGITGIGFNPELESLVPQNMVLNS